MWFINFQISNSFGYENKFIFIKLILGVYFGFIGFTIIFSFINLQFYDKSKFEKADAFLDFDYFFFFLY